MQDTIIKRVFIFGAIAIVGIIAIQAYWGVNTYKQKESEFHQTVHIALIRVAKDIAKSKNNQLPINNLVKKVSSNYYVVNTNSIINAGELEFYLQKEFYDLGLSIDFEYAIHDCETNEMVYGNYCEFEEKPDENLKLGILPKYDEFIYYFGVKFPSRNAYVMGSMKSALLLLLVLLTTIIFFVYALYVILTQQRLSEMQKDFINNMTHEFKTPISTIKISSEVFLKEEKITKDTRLLKYANIIQQQNERLNSQVEKVLQIAKMERDNFKLNKELINIHDMLTSIIQSMEIRVGKHQGKIATGLQAGNPMITADPLHLSNIIQSLIDNAIKYCREKPEIQINTQEKNGKLSLVIKDKGIGIKKEFQTKIFEKFFRVPTGNVHNIKGFGLGLFYIKNICDAHGWRLHLDSEYQKGTEISIEIAQ